MSSDDRREQLLDVTAGIVADTGFQGISILSVARAAGISRPIVYEHFGDLNGLLGALVEREMALALEQVTEAELQGPGDGEPTDLMLESLGAYLTAVEQHPNTWRLVLMPPEGAPEALRRTIAGGRVEVLDKLIQAVRPGLRPGDPDEDPQLTARTLSAIADEYARLVLADPGQFPPERLVQHARWFLGQLAID